MIKTFELFMSTYTSAANKARQLGHPNRADKLQDWTYIGGESNIPGYRNKTPNQIGIFNFSIDIYNFKEPDKWVRDDRTFRQQVLKGKIIKKIMPSKEHNFSNPSDWELIIKGPIEGYLHAIMIDSFIYKSDKFDKITIEPKFIYMVDGKRFIRDSSYVVETPFTISTPVIWEEGLFKINGESIVSNKEGLKKLFSDRKSAAKFKKILLNMADYYPNEANKIKELFMDNSLGEEWGKYLESIKKISTNMLYSD